MGIEVTLSGVFSEEEILTYAEQRGYTPANPELGPVLADALAVVKESVLHLIVSEIGQRSLNAFIQAKHAAIEAEVAAKRNELKARINLDALPVE